jgi:hypothetical protein
MNQSSSYSIAFDIILMVLMILIAPLLDFTGIILFILSFFGIGLVASFVLDICGAGIMGILLYFFNRSTAGLEKGITPVLKTIAPRLGATSLLEAIPFVGDIAPGWTILVIFEIFKKIIKS